VGFGDAFVGQEEEELAAAARSEELLGEAEVIQQASWDGFTQQGEVEGTPAQPIEISPMGFDECVAALNIAL
jgi:hypothetical protein